uniref:Uncharacterized protein LOC100176967 n=1 Tax=Phallusia mammillata TaxID=59560 RepID=A0A6F9DHA4_9ASCI|nr:uncharacterized protein LOC100176967 [Phallusia mammillata]
MDGNKSTNWIGTSSAITSGENFVVFRLPKFYVLRRIKLRLNWSPGSVTEFRLSYWNDKNFQRYVVGGDNQNWKTLKEFNVPENGRRVFGGFSRQSRYWKMTFTSTHGGEPPSVSDVALFIFADLPPSTIEFDIEPSQPVDPFDEGDVPPPMAAPEGDTCEEVEKPVPGWAVSQYNLDTSFYRKFTSAYGIPIMGNWVLDDRALQRACYVVRFMLSDRRDIRDHMYSNKGRVAIIGRQETVPQVPGMRQYTWWTRRAAGGTYENPVNVGAEENMLCEPQDGYAPAQDIFMHEFAHGIHLIAARTAIRDFNYRLQQSFMSARRAGLWSNTYANTDNREYFAEGVQAYFNQQREGRPGGDGIQNHVNTREELRQHDPGLYSLVQEIFPCSNPYIPRCDDLYQTKALAQKFTMDCNGGGGIVPTPGPAGCKDDNPSCAAWKESGECQANPSYMLVSCKLSCGVCGISTSTISPISTTDTTTPPVTDPTCKDDNVYCDYWMRTGECEINPNYMLQSCRKSCRSCRTTPTSTTMPVSSSQTTQSQTATTGLTTGQIATGSESLTTGPTTGPLTTGSETLTTAPTTGPITTGSEILTTGPTTDQLTTGTQTVTTGPTTDHLTTGSQTVTTGPTTDHLTTGTQKETTGPTTDQLTTGTQTLTTGPTTDQITTASTTTTAPTPGEFHFCRCNPN